LLTIETDAHCRARAVGQLTGSGAGLISSYGNDELLERELAIDELT